MSIKYCILSLACLLGAHFVGAQHHRPSQEHHARKKSGAVSLAPLASPSPIVSSVKLAASPVTSVPAVKPAVGGRGDGNRCNGPWQLSEINATTTKLPNQTQRVLICIISTGVLYNISYLKHNRWSGCSKENPLDPGGCALNWQAPVLDGNGKPKPRGTFAAAIMAARPGSDRNVSGVIQGGADIYVVPVDTDTAGATDPTSQASGGKSRIHAYSNCEGRLRGLQAQDVGPDAPPVRWRMVMYVDVRDKQPATPVGTQNYNISESDWFTTAVNKTDDGHQPDVLVIAPAGDISGQLSYPAAYTHVVAVGGYNCTEQPLISYSNTNSTTKPDIMAPGYIHVPNITSNKETGKDIPWNGTAPAAALTAAAAARLWSAYPDCSADVIKQAILSNRPRAGLPAMLSLQAATAYLDKQKHKCIAG